MTSEDLFRAVQAAPSKDVKTLAQHFGEYMYEYSPGNLEEESQRFLKVMTTWVYRALKARRKGGIPMGMLEKFVLPDAMHIDLLQTTMCYVLRILQKRGLYEREAQKANQTFKLLVRAYNRAGWR